MRRLMAILALAGQIAVLATQLHCPMIGMTDHVDADGGAVTQENAHAHHTGSTIVTEPGAVAHVDGQPAAQVDDCVMASGCLSSTAALARAPRAGVPAFTMFDEPATIAAIESATTPHTTPPPRHPVLFA